MAEPRDSAPATRRPHRWPARPRRRGRTWRPVLAVTLVVAALTAGWPLIAATLGDRQRLAAGQTLRLGPDDEVAVLRVAGHGWGLSKSASNPDSDYTLSRDGVGLAARYVPLAGTSDPGALWEGLAKVQSVADSGSRLGPARPLPGVPGALGRTGTLTGGDRTGSATLWLAPGRGYAVEIIVQAGPGAAPGAVADATAMAHGLTFAQGTP
ncbi:hypothetical protein AB0O07_35135 [Streptomyces sp. NPDC093085]|uniref:hypothetical protein n=1 Tax=Streptomyces sp. NPDC093085 TaxID=3155068 RepID=UPI0034281BE0